jgi:hypothetical protein
MTVQLSMDRIQVGQYLPGCRTHGRYVRAEIADGLWRIFVGVPTMTQSELDAFRAGEIRLAAAKAGECAFLLLRFGSLPWERAPLAPIAETAERMAFIFVDADSGVAQAIRILPLPAAAAADIRSACADLPADAARRRKAERESPGAEDLLPGAEVFVLAEEGTAPDGL